MNCPGSNALLKVLEIPEDTDEPDYRTNGVAAHEAAAVCLEKDIDSWELIGEKFNGVEVDLEIATAVQVYLDHCRALVGLEARMLIEHRISHPDHPLFYGTVDFGADDEPADTLHVRDYKHGEGIQVDVWDNPQIMYYMYGLLRLYPRKNVTLGIVQPRGFHAEGPIRVWETTAAYINDWAAEELIPAMLRAEMDHDLDAGPWCRFCPAKLVCPLLTSLFGAACNADPKHVVNLNDASLGRSYQYTAAVKMYLKALEDETYRRLNAGGAVPGTKLVLKRANRVWSAGAAKEATRLFGEDAMSKPEMKSPAEIDKIGAKGKAFTKENAYTPQTGLTVALEDDSRIAVKVQSTTEAFGAAVAALATAGE